MQNHLFFSGITKNMFFINHDRVESSMQETQSHLNLHEAEFIVELCRYVILQGYDTSQVTILTCYSGQLHQIRQLVHDHQLFSGVRTAVVDNYQGEGILKSRFRIHLVISIDHPNTHYYLFDLIHF